jgi:hypothetical protein
VIDVSALVVACLDVGSPRKTGWAVFADGKLRTGTEIATLAVELGGDLAIGRSIALGFQCPLYVPVRADPAELLQQREGEGGRPWSAAAGAGVLVAGLAQMRWLMSTSSRKDIRNFVERPAGHNFLRASRSSFFGRLSFVLSGTLQYCPNLFWIEVSTSKTPEASGQR